MNWRELKEFCISLDEKQLKKKVILWRENEAVNNVNTEILPEDMYIDPEVDEEGCYPESDALEPIENLKKVYDMGDPILWEKF